MKSIKILVYLFTTIAIGSCIIYLRSRSVGGDYSYRFTILLLWISVPMVNVTIARRTKDIKVLLRTLGISLFYCFFMLSYGVNGMFSNSEDLLNYNPASQLIIPIYLIILLPFFVFFWGLFCRFIIWIFRRRRKPESNTDDAK